MKIKDAIRNAMRVYTRRGGDTLWFLVTEGCMTLICLTPALFLFDASLRMLAWGVIPMWLLVMLPLRMNAAAVMQDALEGGSLFQRALGDFSGYGRKLLCGLKRAGFLLLWGLPAIFMAYQIREHVSGEMDGFTLMRMIRSDFGGGDLVRGVLVIAGIVVGTGLLILIGCAFHSGARHAFALGDPALPRGRHGKIVGIWVVSLISILPMLIALGATVVRYLPAFQDLNGLFMKTVQLPSTRGTVLILGMGALLTIPLLPLRSLIIAACMHGLRKEKSREA